MRLRLALALSGVLAATAAAGWWYATQRPIPVAVADVAEDVPVTVFGLGVIEARVLSRVGFEVPGRLVAVLADHGDRVSAGAALARLDVESQEARVAKAEAAVLSADAAAARIEAQRARSEAMLAQRQSTARRRRELAARGAGSTEAAELADTEARAAQADLAVSRADVQLARAAQAEALASLQTERTALARHTLTAPFDALVVARSREPGAALTPGEAVFTLIAPDSIWGLAYVDEGHAGDLAVGQPAMVTLRSRPGSPIRAAVVRIGLEADRVTEERRVYVRCLACPATPVIGEQAEVVIETARLARARLVPESAVHGFDGAQGMVWTVEDGRLARRHVRVAARLMDGRVALTAQSLPESIPVAVQVEPGFAEGRAARAVVRP